MKDEIISEFQLDYRTEGELINVERTVALVEDEHDLPFDMTEVCQPIIRIGFEGDDGIKWVYFETEDAEIYVRNELVKRARQFAPPRTQGLIGQNPDILRLVLRDSDYNLVLAGYNYE